MADSSDNEELQSKVDARLRTLGRLQRLVGDVGERAEECRVVIDEPTRSRYGFYVNLLIDSHDAPPDQIDLEWYDAQIYEYFLHCKDLVGAAFQTILDLFDQFRPDYEKFVEQNIGSYFVPAGANHLGVIDRRMGEIAASWVPFSEHDDINDLDTFERLLDDVLADLEKLWAYIESIRKILFEVRRAIDIRDNASAAKRAVWVAIITMLLVVITTVIGVWEDEIKQIFSIN